MTADEAGEMYSRQQIRQEAIRALGSVDETRRLTDPGERAPEPAVAQTQDPPRVQRRSRRARYEGLPLHSPRPAVVDVPVIVPPLPPRPHGMFYAPGWPEGYSQQYMWPPQQGFPPSQYPPWSSVPPMGQQGYTPQEGYSGQYSYTPQQGYSVPPMVTPMPHQSYSVPPGVQQAFPQPFYAGEGSSQQQFAGLDTFVEDYRPQYSSPSLVPPSALSTSFIGGSHSSQTGGICRDARSGDRDDDEDEDDEDEDEDDEDDDPVDGDQPDDRDDDVHHGNPGVRRNPARCAREKCIFSPYEHDRRHCRDYHARRRDQ